MLLIFLVLWKASPVEFGTSHRNPLHRPRKDMSFTTFVSSRGVRNASAVCYAIWMRLDRIRRS